MTAGKHHRPPDAALRRRSRRLRYQSDQLLIDLERQLGRLDEIRDGLQSALAEVERALQEAPRDAPSA
jgi:hypothetical protein